MINIETLNDKKQIKKEIDEQYKNFNIKNFYNDDGNAAVGILSPHFTRYAYSIKEHGKVAEKIYKTIYEDFDGFDFYKFDNAIIWQEQSSNMGNICIQLASFVPTLIWIPQKINMYQYQNLLEFYNEVKTLPNYEKNQFITTVKNIDGNDLYLEDALTYIKTLIMDEEVSLNQNVRIR